MIHGFTHGFSLEFSGERGPQSSTNSKSALENLDIVSQKIEKEIEAGRVAGPFKIRPPNLKTSPLGLVPKKTGGFRLIHNLSYAENTDSSSVNEGIPHEACRVQYAGIDEAVALVKANG